MSKVKIKHELMHRVKVLERAVELACDEITPHALAETSDYKGISWGTPDTYFIQQAEHDLGGNEDER